MSDRTVHGLTKDGHQIVRYDRAGKWYVEPRDARRKQLTVTEAAELSAAGTHYARLMGGSAFDAKVRHLIAVKEQS